MVFFTSLRTRLLYERLEAARCPGRHCITRLQPESALFSKKPFKRIFIGQAYPDEKWIPSYSFRVASRKKRKRLGADEG